MTDFTPQRKIGERVLVEGIIEEVRETKKGTQYQIMFENHMSLISWVTVNEDQIKEVIGYDTTTKAEV